MIKDSKGFTLIEMLIVCVIIGWLAGMAVVRYHHMDSTKENFALTNMKSIASALEIFWADTGGYPTTGQGLDVLLVDDATPIVGWQGPYFIGSRLPTDPWKNWFIYLLNVDPNTYTLYSMGPNGEDDSGSPDDIVF